MLGFSELPTVTFSVPEPYPSQLYRHLDLPTLQLGFSRTSEGSPFSKLPNSFGDNEGPDESFQPSTSALLAVRVYPFVPTGTIAKRRTSTSTSALLTVRVYPSNGQDRGEKGLDRRTP